MRKVTGWTILKDAARGGLASDEVMRRIQSAGWDAARPLILWAYRHVQRGLVAAIELRVDRELERAEEPQDRVSIRQRLAEKTFALPTGETVYWSLATDEQHDARADWLEKHALFCKRTARRHRKAAEEIRQAGVSCLADLGPRATKTKRGRGHASCATQRSPAPSSQQIGGAA